MTYTNYYINLTQLEKLRIDEKTKKARESLRRGFRKNPLIILIFIFSIISCNIRAAVASVELISSPTRSKTTQELLGGETDLKSFLSIQLGFISTVCFLILKLNSAAPFSCNPDLATYFLTYLLSDWFTELERTKRRGIRYRIFLNLLDNVVGKVYKQKSPDAAWFFASSREKQSEIMGMFTIFLDYIFFYKIDPSL